jgi:hypothetical protein
MHFPELYKYMMFCCAVYPFFLVPDECETYYLQITLSNTHFGASNVRPVSGYIWPADSKNSTSFPLSALVFEIQNICHIPLFTLLAHKKSWYFIVVFKLIYFKHEGNILKSKRKVHYTKIYLFRTKSTSLWYKLSNHSTHKKLLM